MTDTPVALPPNPPAAGEPAPSPPQRFGVSWLAVASFPLAILAGLALCPPIVTTASVYPPAWVRENLQVGSRPITLVVVATLLMLAAAVQVIFSKSRRRGGMFIFASFCIVYLVGAASFTMHLFGILQ